MLAHVETIVGPVNFDLLILVLLAETLIVNGLSLVLKILPDGLVLGQDVAFVRIDSLPIHVPSLIVQLSLLFLLILEIFLVPVHESLVLVSPLLDLVSELGMFLRNPNLLLQALFLVMQLAKSVLEHHCLP